MVANATGCSSIYGGNLPTTPWTVGPDGRGPAWSNSLFRGQRRSPGFRLTADRHTAPARRRVSELRDAIGPELVDEILAAPQQRESGASAPSANASTSSAAASTASTTLPPRIYGASSITSCVGASGIVGGDGWKSATSGPGGLDHRISATGRDVNVPVLDTEVYSNTGGYVEVDAPRSRRKIRGRLVKTVPKKTLAVAGDRLQRTIYAAWIAMGADPQQTLEALRARRRTTGRRSSSALQPLRTSDEIEMREGP